MTDSKAWRFGVGGWTAEALAFLDSEAPGE
ncbi:hypothetical protein A8926_1225 [Saccharopolyspora spinosa]|uniref:Uncharacterized protein n=1 Tax=Saccharopolyspora spinosa TaxID=60894 RepID=A0A2N3XSL2_SACSN|nr:hypothetical protein A8926_1225 [Saccharopolyspora spinosa]